MIIGNIFDHHGKLRAALERYGEDRFEADAQAMLERHPRCRIVLGLLGGPSVAVNPNGRGNWSHTAGRSYARMAIRFERGQGIVDVRPHAGPYLYITL